MDCFWNVSTFSFFLVLLVFFLAFIAGFAYCIDCVNYLQADGVRDVFDCAPAAATDVQTTQSVQRWTQPSAGISARPRLLTRYTSSRRGCTQPLLLQLDVDLTVIRPRYAHSTTRLHCGLVNTQVTAASGLRHRDPMNYWNCWISACSEHLLSTVHGLAARHGLMAFPGLSCKLLTPCSVFIQSSTVYSF